MIEQTEWSVVDGNINAAGNELHDVGNVRSTADPARVSIDQGWSSTLQPVLVANEPAWANDGDLVFDAPVALGDHVHARVVFEINILDTGNGDRWMTEVQCSLVRDDSAAGTVYVNAPRWAGELPVDFVVDWTVVDNTARCTITNETGNVCKADVWAVQSTTTGGPMP